MLLEAIGWGTGCALIGLVYSVVLPNESTPLGWWFDILQSMDNHGKWSWLGKPLGACEKCFSGQLALWTSWLWMQKAMNWPVVAFCLVSAASAILIAPILTKLYQWTQQ